MINIGGKRIQPIDGLTEEDLVEILDHIINFAKSNPQGHERETYDFKKELNIKTARDKYELRKDFASFANTCGGIIIVGIDDHLNIVGVNANLIPKDSQLSQILSEREYIRPPMGGLFRSRMIKYQGKDVILYYIPQSEILIEVRKNRKSRWEQIARKNDRKDQMDSWEISNRFARGFKRLPLHLCVDTSRLGFYSSHDDDKHEPFVEWTIKNHGEMYKWLKLMWMPLIPIPVPVMPFRYTSEVYSAYSMWHGDYSNFQEILVDLENKIQEMFGISYEFWTVPLSGPKTYLEDHTYRTGSGAKNLQICLHELKDKQRVTKYGWIIFSKPVVHIIYGGIYPNHASIQVISLISSIPNCLKFISLDDEGRILLEPLLVNKGSIGEIVEERIRFSEEYIYLEDLPNNILNSLPSANILGYLGDKPRPRSFDFPFRANGISILQLMGDINKWENLPPLITNTTHVFSYINSAPRGLNDLEDVKIGTIQLNVMTKIDAFSDMILVLFSIESYVNQSKNLRVPPSE